MKFLKVFFIGLFVLLALIVVGMFIFIKTYDVNKNLPVITAQISQAIGHELSISHADIGFSLNEGLFLELKDIKIAQHPKVEARDLISIDQAHLGLDLSTFLFKHEIQSTQIKLKSIRFNAGVCYLEAQDLLIKVEHFSFDKPFNVLMNMTAYSKSSSNVNLSAQVSLDLPHASVLISNLRISSDLSLWDWVKLKQIAPMIESLPVWINPDIKGQLGVYSERIQLNAKTISDFTIKIEAQLGQGTMRGNIDVKSLLQIPAYAFEMSIKSVKIEDVLDEKNWPVGIVAALSGQIQGYADGKDPSVLTDHFTAKGQFILDQARLDRLNLLKIIFDRLNIIPGLGGVLQEAVPVEISERLNTQTTLLDEVKARFHIEQKIITADEVRLDSKLLSLSLQGSMDFALNTKMAVDTYLSADISAVMVKKAKTMKGLLDEQGRLYLPGHLSGKAPDIKYLPDVGYITKKLVVSEGTEQISQQIEKVLDKNPNIKGILNAVLGGQDNTETQRQEPEQNDGSGSQSSPEQSAPKKAINSFLKKILQ